MDNLGKRDWCFIVHPDGSSDLIVPKQEAYTQRDFEVMLKAIKALEEAMLEAWNSCK